MQTRQQGSSFLTELKQRLLLTPSEAASAGTRYNVPLINSLVLYAGMQVILCSVGHFLVFSSSCLSDFLLLSMHVVWCVLSLYVCMRIGYFSFSFCEINILDSS